MPAISFTCDRDDVTCVSMVTQSFFTHDIMKSIRYLKALLLPSLFIISFAMKASAAEEADFVSIFNGKDLSDWDGKPGAWEVRDGEIWCTGKTKERNWLIWRKEQPADFVLRLEFRWDSGNSGVQVRSDDLGDWQVYGYQAEVAPQNRMGLWHHSLLDKENPRREERHLMATAGQEVTLAADGSKTVKQVKDPKEVQAHFKEHEWNTMEIIAKGPKLIHKVNGVTFATVIDHDKKNSRRKGFIALQDHGKGCVVAFRKIRLSQVNK